MLKALRQGKAEGIVIHKIDRSARNLGDWADLGDLIGAGFDIHLAHEPLDLRSRGGRLSADILAVVAADFVRNNRKEARNVVAKITATSPAPSEAVRKSYAEVQACNPRQSRAGPHGLLPDVAHAN